MKKLPALLLSFFLALSFAITSAKTGAQEAALPLYIDSEGFLGMSHDGVYRLLAGYCTHPFMGERGHGVLRYT